MQHVLVAGATGYLGSRITASICDRPYHCRALVRNPAKLEKLGITPDEVCVAGVTDRSSLRGCCDGIDTVISTVGITRQKDGLSYLDVDYQANMNLLEEARGSGVRKFIYVSVLNGEKLRHLKICDAKEKFVEQLKNSGIEFCVIRPNGFFSDMSDYLQMATAGRVYLFGSGGQRINPIDGADLATFCVDAISSPEKELNVGGPETLTHRDIAIAAFEVLGKEPKLSRIPDWMRRFALLAIRTFTSSRVYGPLEFFMTVTSMDMIAPEFGSRTLREHFATLHGKGT